MTKLFLAAGVAALAIAAPAAAEKGGNKGGGGDKGQAAKVERGGGGGGSKGHSAHIERRGGGGSQAKAMRFERRGGGEQRAAMFERGGKGREARIESRGGDKVRAFKADREQRRELRVAKRDKQEQRVLNRIERRDDRSDRIERIAQRNRDVVRVRDWDDDDRWANARNNCPPGLDKKDNGCLPPGQAKKTGVLIPAAYRERMLPLALRDLYRDDDDHYYRYGDGYVYRVNRQNNLVASLLPLIGGGYNVGQMFPTSYMNSYVPDYYRPFYPDSSDDYYRYANGYVYEIDRGSGLIENMIPMYDNGYGVGQMLPASYSYYNVPYQYRSWYEDDDDYYYRYAPGAIYQVDRSSNLITSIASLLAGDLGVGSRLPMSYSAYNVPLSYRDQYYDTNDAWYRYNDGYIYQVDPTTQLITAVISALV